ncbi:MaoC family dehydratase [Iodidimonas sp. SYSU 1G8]|uniref:MaoC family dehydratase n=1 Tax=Iodidimonas sp. SYSU 1G8 TaxID=3133967 RepID=UPI0031FEBA54
MAQVTTHFDTIDTLVGQKIGTSDWLTVDQERVNKFAEATGDFQWIHVNPERAAKEFMAGGTIAHGYLTLSLLPCLMQDILKVEGVGHGINYGSNKVRFTNMVKVGSRVRAHQTLKKVDKRPDGGKQATYEITVEIEGQERPALIAETLGLIYPGEGYSLSKD